MAQAPEMLWKALQFRPQLASHIRTLHVHWPGVKYITSPPFEKRLEYIFLHTSNLSHVELTPAYGKDEENWETILAILTSLARLKTKPKVSFRRMLSYTSERDTLTNFERILRFELPVIKLQARGTLAGLSYVARFRQLERLEIYSSAECQDLCAVLNDIPLIKLTVIVKRNDLITSFPPNLRILRLYLSYSVTRLFHLTWIGICGLNRLDELVIHCRTVEDGPSCRFESSNLRVFEFVVDHEREATVIPKIISSVFGDCCRLAVFRFRLNPFSSTNLSSIIIPTSTLNVSPRSSLYIFQTLVDYGKIRRPRNTLPWPTGDDGVSERLTMEQAQQLAAARPKSDEIEFQLSESAQNPYWRSEFDSSNISPYDQSELRSKLGRMSEYALLQSFEMARLINESSPCLNICTFFFHFEENPDIQGDCGQNTVMFLSLEQVRRHNGH
jgi:hypothetical protein